MHVARHSQRWLPFTMTSFCFFLSFFTVKRTKLYTKEKSKCKENNCVKNDILVQSFSKGTRPLLTTRSIGPLCVACPEDERAPQ